MRTISAPSIETLGRHAFLEGAPPEALAALLRAARCAEVEAGAMVIDFEAVSSDVFLVLSGSLRAIVRTADGRRTHIVGDFPGGDVVGEMSAIDGVPRSARVEALVLSRLCILPAGAFLDLALASPTVCLRLLRRLTGKLRVQTDRLLEHAAMSARMRLITELLRLSRERSDGKLVVSPRPTQEELAARIGTRRETVARELMLLRRQGLVRQTRATILLCDPEAMRATLTI